MARRCGVLLIFWESECLRGEEGWSELISFGVGSLTLIRLRELMLVVLPALVFGSSLPALSLLRWVHTLSIWNLY
jgi:hypothetical protein